jgi:hypothetical protein
MFTEKGYKEGDQEIVNTLSRPILNFTDTVNTSPASIINFTYESSPSTSCVNCILPIEMAYDLSLMNFMRFSFDSARLWASNPRLTAVVENDLISEIHLSHRQGPVSEKTQNEAVQKTYSVPIGHSLDPAIGRGLSLLSIL